MKVHWSQLGDRLVSASGQSTREVLLIAPFVKVRSLDRVIASVPASVPIRCVTRWRLEEVAAGVSDLECYQALATRGNSSLLLCANLHTKYYRFDALAFLGSANLTHAALGWSANPNAEALIEFDSDQQKTTESFESSVLSTSVVVDSALHAEFESMLAEYVLERPLEQVLSQEEAVTELDEPNAALRWFPTCRSPEYMFRTYSGDINAMSREGLRAAIADLRYLDLPESLSEVSFYQIIRSRLISLAVIADLDKFLSQPRRFGEMRVWTHEYFEVEDATDAWQTFMRWLTHFLSHRYQVHTEKYSEIFSRTTEK